MAVKILRALISLIFGATGAFLAYMALKVVDLAWLREFVQVPWRLLVLYGLFVVLFALIGYLIAPFILKFLQRLAQWVEGKLTNLPAADLVGGALGIIVGLLIANLFQNSYVNIPFIGPVLSVALSLFLGYVGMVIGIKRKEDLWGFLTFLPRLKGEKGEKTEKGKESKTAKGKKDTTLYKVLDTSVIIDGRIADIVKTGFLDGVLLVPGFVLEELRHIADSSDLLKRNRGRRGLDILNAISKEKAIEVEVYEKDFDDVAEVDSKLVRLAQTLHCPVLTNDYNLNKVAELQGVKVLNINELANALKPVVLPGEEMYVQVVKEGKEAGQGVAYLDDGTMIVIDSGRRFIGQEIIVLVTTVLQTAAGRMIFAKPKSMVERSFEEYSREMDALG